jgi:hypothetical protein
MRLACDRALVEMEGDSRLEKALALYDTAQSVEPTLRFALAGTERSTLGAVAEAPPGDGPLSRRDRRPLIRRRRSIRSGAQPVVGVGAVAPQARPAGGSGIRTSRDR